MHFDEGLSARYDTGDSTKLVTKGTRGKSALEKLTVEGLVKFSARVALEKLTEEGLVKFSARVAIQVNIVESYNDSDGH